MKKKHSFILLFSLLFLTNAFSQSTNFKYKREVSGVNTTWHKLSLPLDIFEHCNENGSDFRILSINENDTIESAYILKTEEDKIERVEIPIKTIQKSNNENGYFYTFVNEKEEAINEIQLQFGLANFEFLVDLEGSFDQKEWFQFIKEERLLSISNSQVQFTHSKVAFTEVKYPFIRLRVQSKTNPQLLQTSIFREIKTEGKKVEVLTFLSEIVQNKKEKESIIYLDFNKKVPLNSLELEIDSKIDFYRDIQIFVFTDSVKTEKGWIENYRSIFQGNLNSFQKPIFHFEKTIGKKFKIVVYNQDNEPLIFMNSIAKTFETYLLVRFVEAKKHYLMYGNANAEFPNYDVTLFEKNIPQNISEATLTEEINLETEDIESQKPLFENKMWLYGIMAIIILLLGWFSIKMIKGKT